MGVKLVTGRRREPRKNREAGWLLIYFFLRPPLFSIGTKEGSAPPASRHPARNLTLCKQPERKKDETGYTNRHSRGSLGAKKKKIRVPRCASLPVHYITPLVMKKRSKKHDAPCNRACTCVEKIIIKYL